MGELDGKVAIVTGAGRLRGIGRAAAVALARLGADVVVTGNAGCSLQLQAALRKRSRPIRVVHPVEVLDLSYRGAAGASPFEG